VESLCRRVIVINHGRIIFDDRTSVLKRQFLRRKIIDARFAERLTEPFTLPGVTVLKQGSHGVKLEFDSRELPVQQVIQQLMATIPAPTSTSPTRPWRRLFEKYTRRMSKK
jgi:ABC-2 type transport system ATP-binding protein